MKQSRYQVLLEKELLEALDDAAKKKGISRAEHIKDLLKDSLNEKIKPEKEPRKNIYQLYLPTWLKDELLKRTEKEKTSISKYVREVCLKSIKKKEKKT